MTLQVVVKPNARKEELTQLNETTFQIKVGVPPEGGKANKRVIELLAKHLGLAKSRLQILRGHKSRNKVIVVSESV